jgi:hypothetical protein
LTNVSESQFRLDKYLEYIGPKASLPLHHKSRPIIDLKLLDLFKNQKEERARISLPFCDVNIERLTLASSIYHILLTQNKANIRGAIRNKSQLKQDAIDLVSKFQLILAPTLSAQYNSIVIPK